ncbi:MAG: TolC family protein, partial [Terriglobales bacterium]
MVAGLVVGSLSALAQGLPTSMPMNASTPAPAASMPSALTQSQNPLFGSVASGKATPEVLPLSALDAIDRGLKYNLSLLLAEQATTAARGARYRALADVLPNLSSHVAESVQQINLASFGITLPGVPSIVGPFAIFDARVLASGTFFDLHALNLLRARTEDVNAAQLDLQNARDLIVLVVGGTYMQALAGEARIVSVEAQLATAQALYRQALDMKNAGMVPGIDV